MTADPRDLLGPVLAAAVEVVVSERIAEALADLDFDREVWPPYMDVPTASRYLGFPTPEPLRKLIARRAVAVVQEAPGHRVALARDDLDAYMREHRQEAR